MTFLYYSNLYLFANKASCVPLVIPRDCPTFRGVR